VNKILITIIMLTGSNLFMTFAWYGHLKHHGRSPWILVALLSWGIALFEYLIQVPANRIGHQVMNLGQLKILQEAITLSVFMPFCIFYMKEGVKQDYIWAAVFIFAAVVCVFRGTLIKG